MSDAFARLIPPDVRARLKTLQLSTRRDAGAHGYGMHRSVNRGAGLEFSQYRAYEPGDELRQVDWKLYARCDRYYVREAERDSPLTVWLLIDASASMAQGDAARAGWSRLDAARAIAACAVELALRQGDRFGIASAGGGSVRLLAANVGARHRDRCLLELAALQPRGAWPDAAGLRPLWQHIGARALVLLLSDCFDDGVVSLAERFAAARREMVTVQLLTAEERDFPFRGGHRFRDPETDDDVLGDGAAVREGFLARFADARAALATRFAAAGIRHATYVLDQPLDAPLQRLFGAHFGTARR
ncbi:MAG: DUF58 domain-containing protein [Luteimonas sp.]